MKAEVPEQLEKEYEQKLKQKLAKFKEEQKQKLSTWTDHDASLEFNPITKRFIGGKRAANHAEIARLERKSGGLNRQLKSENKNWVDLSNQQRAIDKALKATQEELKGTQKNVEDVGRKCSTEHPTPAQKAVQVVHRFVSFFTRKKETFMYEMTPYLMGNILGTHRQDHTVPSSSAEASTNRIFV